MYRVLFVLVTLFFAGNLYAQQVNVDNETMQQEVEKPTSNIGISSEQAPKELVEGVGNVPYNKVAFRTGPSLKHNVIRYSAGAEKVLLIGESGDWFKVIMHNGEQAYIQKRYVRTVKIFIDETVVKNQMNKTLSYELSELLYKYDKTMSNSSYLKKYHTRPMLDMVDARNVKNVVILTFNYSCVTETGRPIPSYNNNPFANNLKQLLEIILGKLVLTNADKYNIVIKVPTFDNEGNVLHYNKEYVTISLDPAKVDISNVRKDEQSLLSLSTVSIKLDDLFKEYPK